MPIIEVDHVTKEFQLGQLTSLKDTVLNGLRRLSGRPTVQRPQFKALDDVSFSIEPGEIVGVIGHNGAGKSTLLKLLSRISQPTSGRIAVKGKVAPLIEVGAGMVPDLTGRENIYLNGSILGIPRREIERRFDEIVGFAELEEFIDTPIKRYSSGMKVRLGFSLATSLQSEILIIDEVLAVGDLAFQRKCFDRMEDLIRRQDRTVLLVSHNIRQVERLCVRALLMDHGRIVMDGHKTQVCEAFYQQSNAKIAAQVAENVVSSRHVRKTGEVELVSLALIDQSGAEVDELVMGEPATIRCVFDARRPVPQPEIILGFHTTDFFYISSFGNGHLPDRPDFVEGPNVVECRVASLPLMPGVYALRVGVLDGVPRELFYGEMLKSFPVRAGGIPRSRLPGLGVVHIDVQWQARRGAAPGEDEQRQATEETAGWNG